MLLTNIRHTKTRRTINRSHKDPYRHHCMGKSQCQNLWNIGHTPTTGAKSILLEEIGLLATLIVRTFQAAYKAYDIIYYSDLLAWKR